MSLKEGPEEKLVEREKVRCLGVAVAAVVREEVKGWLKMEMGILAFRSGGFSVCWL